MKEKEKNYSCAPLPFMGQKRRFVKHYKQVLSDVFYGKEIIVDLFGGSGLLSHVAKRMFPDIRVIYNDYDYYSRRIGSIGTTNCILKELRIALTCYPEDKLLTNELKSKVIDILKKYEDKGYVDYITLSSSLLFSMNYALSLKEFAKQSLYNCVRKNDYDAATDYLQGVEITHSDYKELYKAYKDKPNVLFVIDPPYLSTQCDVYDNYWKLADYLDVIHILKCIDYIYFTSNKSSIIELCEWMDGGSFTNPFKGATKEVVTQKIGINTTYQDIMLYKKATLKDYFNAA